MFLPMKDRVSFLASAGDPDGFGGETVETAERFSAWAKITYLRGGERVQAGRLAGTQTIVVTLRKSSDTARVTPQWQLRDQASGTLYDIRAIEPNRDRPRRFLDLLCEGVS
jgi:SPP1 family predicted phage head-tail adaptor